MEYSRNGQNKPLKKFGTRHLQSVLLCSCQGIAFGTRASLSVAIVAMTDMKSKNTEFPVFDWDSEKKSLILSSLFWGAVITQIPIGCIINKGGSKKFLCFGLLLNGVANILTPVLASSFGWIAVLCCRIIMGMCQGAVSPCLHKLLSNWAPPSERATLGSFVINGAQLGTVLFMSLSGVLAQSKLGWPSVFYIFGAVSIIWSILFWYMGADSPCEHPRICPKELQYIDSSLEKLDKTIESQGYEFPWKAIITSLPVWSLIIVSSGQGWCYYIFLNLLPSYMTYVLKFDLQMSGELSALPYLVMWLMGFPFSWLSDTALRKGVPVNIVRKTCNTIAMWCPALALLALCLTHTDNKIIYIGIFVVTIGLNAGVTCGLEINHIDLTPNFAGTLVAFTNSLVKICGFLSPIFAGFIIKDMTNEQQWHIVFYVTALIYFVVNTVFLLFGSAEKQLWNHQNIIPNCHQKPRLSIISASLEGELSICNE